MKVSNALCFNVLMLASAATLASNVGVPLGGAAAPLGDAQVVLGAPGAVLGSEVGLPALVGIAALGLIAGIRYIRNRR